MNRTSYVYIISDSIGETAEFVVKAAASQFDANHFVIRKHAGVNREESLQAIVSHAADEGALIAFTFVVSSLRDKLLELSKERQVTAIDIMGPMLQGMEQLVGSAPLRRPGVVHQLDADYYRRVEAVEFAVKYDDGRDPRGLERADVILVGVSRTSKTPLSMYLAHRQLRVANVPLVPEVKPPSQLFQTPCKHKVIGLTIEPTKLTAVRQARLETLGLANQAPYASEHRIVEELAYADDIMRRIGCPVIDVSNRAVEETASVVLDYVQKREA